MKPFLVILSALVVAACTVIGVIWFAITHLPMGEPKSEWVKIIDTTQPTNVLLVAGHQPSYFWFHLRGHIDGTADISVGEPGAGRVRSDFSNHLAGGYVDWASASDYFATGVVFQYKPVNVKTGVLVIEYSLR